MTLTWSHLSDMILKWDVKFSSNSHMIFMWEFFFSHKSHEKWISHSILIWVVWFSCYPMWEMLFSCNQHETFFFSHSILISLLWFSFLVLVSNLRTFTFSLEYWLITIYDPRFIMSVVLSYYSHIGGVIEF